MRHLGRTHRVSVAWMHETFSPLAVQLLYEKTHRKCADIYTKSFADATKWYAACLLIGVVDRHHLTELLRNFAEHEKEKEEEDCKPELVDAAVAGATGCEAPPLHRRGYPPTL